MDFLHLAGVVLLLLGGLSQGKLVLRQALRLLLGRLHSLILPCFALDSASLCVLITFQRSVSINTIFSQLQIDAPQTAMRGSARTVSHCARKHACGVTTPCPRYGFHTAAPFAVMCDRIEGTGDGNSNTPSSWPAVSLFLATGTASGAGDVTCLQWRHTSGCCGIARQRSYGGTYTRHSCASKLQAVLV